MSDPYDPDLQEPHIAMMKIITSRWLAQAVTGAADIGIADHMTREPRDVAELAQAIGGHEDSLYRLLKALTAFGIFAQPEPRRFALTPLGETLRSDSAHSMRGVARFFGHETMVRAWARLPYAVQHGKPALDQVTGVTGFEFVGKDPAMAAIFNEAMRSFSRAEIDGILASYDFAGVQTLADVGGSYGHLLAAILAKHPDMKGVLFDLPHAADGARKTFADAGIAARVEVVAGSIFEKTPPPCDVVILKHVIHNWSDEASIKILKSCAASLRPGGKVLIVEMLEPVESVPHLAKLFDLEMLAMTPGGRERNEADFARLFAEAGLRAKRVVSTPSLVAIIEGARE
jgi:C-methyltransferase